MDKAYVVQLKDKYYLVGISETDPTKDVPDWRKMTKEDCELVGAELRSLWSITKLFPDSMCAQDHPEIRYWSKDGMCPVCAIKRKSVLEYVGNCCEVNDLRNQLAIAIAKVDRLESAESNYNAGWNDAVNSPEAAAISTKLADAITRADALAKEAGRLRVEIVASLTDAGICMLAENPTAEGEITSAVRRLRGQRDAAIARAVKAEARLRNSHHPFCNNKMVALGGEGCSCRITHDSEWDRLQNTYDNLVKEFERLTLHAATLPNRPDWVGEHLQSWIQNKDAIAEQSQKIAADVLKQRDRLAEMLRRLRENHPDNDISVSQRATGVETKALWHEADAMIKGRCHE